MLFVIFLALALINSNLGKFDLAHDGSILKYDFNNCQGLFETDNGNVFFCAKDCVKLLNSNGEEKWSQDSDFTSPVICHAKNFLGVSDIKTNSIHVFDSDGEKYNLKTENNLLAFSVNESGYCATISKDDASYKIDAYDKSANKFFTYVHSEENIFPVNVAISLDGKILAISYVDTNNMNIDSKITFMHTDGDEIFASASVKNNFVSGLNFLSNNDIIIIGEDKIILGCLSRDKFQEKWRIDFETKINMVAFNKNFVAVHLLNKIAAQKKSTIKFYNMSGKNISNFESDQLLSFIKACDKFNCVLIISPDKFLAVNPSSKILWQYDAVGEQKFVAFLGRLNKILFASSTKTYVVDVNNKGE